MQAGTVTFNKYKQIKQPRKYMVLKVSFLFRLFYLFNVYKKYTVKRVKKKKEEILTLKRSRNLQYIFPL